MRRPPTPSAPSRSRRSADVDDLCRRPELTVSAVDNAPSTDAERSLTLPQIRRCRRRLPSTLHRPPTSSVPSRFFRPADRQRCRLCDICLYIYLSVGRSPLIYCPATHTTKEIHHMGFVLQRPRAGEYQTMECRPRAVCSRSTVTPRVYF